MATLREFELYRSIASDRISDLHLGRDAAGTVVAIRMYGARPAAEPSLVEAVITAARKAQVLHHPGVVRVLAVSDAPPHFVATELPRGETLRTILDEAAPLPPILAARMASQIADILDHVHELRDAERRPLGLVHGALCPENVWVTWDGHIKLADVGAPGRTVDARAGGGAPTVSRYMAPEQAIGARVDRRADVFSLGVLLWEALTGARLFDAPTPGDLVTKITIDEIPTAHSRNSDVPDRLSAIVGAALVRSLVRRTPSASTLRRELEDFLAEVGAGSEHATFVTEFMKAGFAEHRARREDQIEHLPAPGKGGTAAQAIAEATTQPTIKLPEDRDSEASIIIDPGLLEDLDAEPTPAPAPPPPAPAPPAAPGVVVASAPPGVAIPTVPQAPPPPAVSPEPIGDLPDTASFKGSRFSFVLGLLALLAIGGGVVYAMMSWERAGDEALAEAARDTGAILVRSDPENARVLFDGHDTGKRTPARIEDVPIGEEHEVIVMLDGYQPWGKRTTALANDRMLHAMLVPEGVAQDTAAADGGTVAEPPPEEPTAPRRPAGAPGAPRREGPRGGPIEGDAEHSAAAASDMGFLSVHTNARATVYFDGRPLGRAPLRKSRVPSGTHSVRVTFDGEDGASRDARVRIQPGWEFTLRVDRE